MKDAKTKQKQNSLKSLTLSLANDNCPLLPDKNHVNENEMPAILFNVWESQHSLCMSAVIRKAKTLTIWSALHSRIAACFYNRLEIIAQILTTVTIHSKHCFYVILLYPIQTPWESWDPCRIRRKRSHPLSLLCSCEASMLTIFTDAIVYDLLQMISDAKQQDISIRQSWNHNYFFFSFSDALFKFRFQPGQWRLPFSLAQEGARIGLCACLLSPSRWTV